MDFRLCIIWVLYGSMCRHMCGCFRSKHSSGCELIKFWRLNWIFSLFQWLGNLTLDAYEDDCEFADPAGSFKGLRRFKRNCTNFGSLLDKSNMKLMKWEDFEVSLLSRFHVSFIICNFPVSHLRHLGLLGFPTTPS